MSKANQETNMKNEYPMLQGYPFESLPALSASDYSFGNFGSVNNALEGSPLHKLKGKHLTPPPDRSNVPKPLELSKLRSFDPMESPVDVSAYEPLSASTLSDAKEESSPKKRERPRSHTPRPPNSFILYRREKHMEIMAQYKGGKTLNNNVISKIVANMWRQETPEVKARFAAKAEEEKRAHMIKYPEYKYRPRKGSSKAKTPTSAKAKKPDATSLVMPRSGVLMNPIDSLRPYPHVLSSSHVYGSFSQQPHYHQMDVGRMERMGNTYLVSDEPSPLFAEQVEFLQSDSMMHSYSPSWPSTVWEMGLDQKPLGSLSPDAFPANDHLSVI